MALSLKEAMTAGRVDDAAMRDPAGYVMADEDLREAARTALLLGKPLLLTGEAGVGKSHFAGWLARELELHAPLEYVVKSTTEARDLFYEYDALARFHEAQIATSLQRTTTIANAALLRASNEAQSDDGQSRQQPGDDGADDTAPAPDDDAPAPARTDALHYISYRPLGTAILRSLGREAVRRRTLMTPAELANIPVEAERSVVLIDEIDKAPRDVPNDLLDEIDRLRFRVRELDSGNIEAHPDRRPVVVITSNSERDLPKPFLRRCIYYHMPIPTDAQIERIVAARLGTRFADGGGGLLAECLRLFYQLREGEGLRQKPGLAELLDWLRAMARSNAALPASLAQDEDWYPSMLAALVKDTQDRRRLGVRPGEWVGRALGPGGDGGD